MTQSQTTSAPETEQPRPDRRGAFRLLFFCLLAIGAGNTMLIGAVLPPLTRELALPDWTAGAIFSLSALLWALASPFWGRLSSRIGRRPVITIGLVGYAASMLLFAIVVQLADLGILKHWLVVFLLLLFARSLHGLIGPGVRAGGQAYVADRTGPENRTEELASMGAGFTLGTAMGPAAAAAMIAVTGLISPLLLAAATAAGMAAMVHFHLPEKRPPRDRGTEQRPSAKGVWKSPTLFPFLVCTFGQSIIHGVLIQTFPFVLMDRLAVEGKEASQLLAAASTIGAMAMLMAQLVIIPRFKLSPRHLIMVGMACLVIYALAMLSAADFGMFCFIQMIWGLGQGLAQPGIIAGASLANRAELQGDVAGLLTSTQGFAFVFSPLFGLWAYEHIHPTAPFLTAVVVLSAASAFTLTRTRSLHS